METIVIPAGRWRKDAAKVLERAMQEATPVVYTVHGRSRFALITIRVRMGLPLQNSLMGQMRQLWTGLTHLPVNDGQPYRMGADDLRRDTSSTLRELPLEPGWFSRRGDIIAALIPAPLGADMPITFLELVEEFWTLVVGWQSRQAATHYMSDEGIVDHTGMLDSGMNLSVTPGRPSAAYDRRPRPFDTGEPWD